MLKTCLLVALFTLVAGAGIVVAETFELRDGDRVVLVGATLIEREQSYGYWETMLTSHYPQRNITFRNLGWSGDTVWGEARAGFGTPADGYKALVEHVDALKPTAMIVSYGLNESFAGQAELARYIEQFKTLTERLGQTKARIAVLSPIRLEKMPPPLPDPEPANQNLWHYTAAMDDVCTARHYPHLDLNRWISRQQSDDQPLRLTENGMHFSPLGYFVTAGMLENELQLPPSGWRVEIDEQGQVARCEGAKLTDLKASPNGVLFTLTSHRLPVTAALRNPGHSGAVSVRGLTAGKYQLLIDGRHVAEAAHDAWSALVALDDPHELRQIEQLRTAIIKKNELYFHRWRPQNVTYLFGFRKHEQGNNAAEIPKFDPLVAEQEAKIADLRVPRPHKFELKKID